MRVSLAKLSSYLREKKINNHILSKLQSISDMEAEDENNHNKSKHYITIQLDGYKIRLTYIDFSDMIKPIY